MEIALDAGAEDVVTHGDGTIEVLTSPETFEEVRGSLENAGLPFDSAEVTMRASTTVALQLSDAEKMVKLLERLEDLDDVQNVYSNADISEEILEQLG